MEQVYLITYDIDNSEDNSETYDKVIEYLEKMNSQRILINVWLMKSSKSKKILLSDLKNMTAEEDGIAIAPLKGAPSLNYPQKGSFAWIKDNF